MRILLVGNYPLDQQYSMQRYAEVLKAQLALRGHIVDMLVPHAMLGTLPVHRSLRKWLGYLDKFLIFPFVLSRRASSYDLVHVCDHSNSMYLGHAGGRPATITCHDLMAVASARGRYAEQTVSWSGKLLQRWILNGLAAARWVICVSTATAKDLEQLAPNPSRKIAVLYNLLHFEQAPAPDDSVTAVRQRLALTPQVPFLLHVGGTQWYKNRIGVLRIFLELKRQLGLLGKLPPRLVMAGKPFSEDLKRFIDQHGLAADVIEAPNQSDAALCALYSGATALLFPSLYEGFGWPIIEAQSCGCPVIASNREPLIEVGGESPLYVDPVDPPAAGRLIADRLDSLAQQREPGMRNAQRFSPVCLMPAYEEFFTAAVAHREE